MTALRKLAWGACGVGLYVVALLSYQAYGRSQYTPEQLERMQSKRDREEKTWQAARDAGPSSAQPAAAGDSQRAAAPDCLLLLLLLLLLLSAH